MRTCALALGLLLGSAGIVCAQTVVTSCEAVPACSAQYLQAQRLSKSGAYEQALQIFTAIHQEYADPVALYPIGVMCDRLGRYAEAASAYERYLAAGVETDPIRVAKVQEQLARARSLVPPQPPPVLKTSVEPPAKGTIEPQATVVPAADILPPAGTSPQQQSVPLYKKGWFWAVLGGSAAAIGLGVGLGVGLSNRGPNLPDGVNTYVATF